MLVGVFFVEVYQHALKLSADIWKAFPFVYVNYVKFKYKINK